MSADPAFVEKVVLLLLTALLSGLGVPYVLKKVEERKLREQKRFEAELSRQARLLEAQARLLDELTRILWTWRYLAKGVVYYGAREDRERFGVARAQYEETVWRLLNELRMEISRARRLVSESAFQRLNALYAYVVHDLDLELSDVARRDTLDVQHCARLASRFSEEVSARLDDALDALASELQLKVRPSAPDAA